jgi:hypothetical protein
MPDSKTGARTNGAASPDSLTRTTGVELAESALDKVSGGGMTQDVTLNKSKVANAAADKLDAYIRG